MRKFTALMIVSAIVMCTGCRANTSEGAGGLINTSASAADTSTAPAETEKTPTAEPEKTSTAEENSTLSGSGTSEKTPDGHFDIGTHSAIWRGADSYYVFYPDGTGGCTMSFENGTGVAFEYETNPDGSTTFHMGAADNSINSEAVNNPDGTMSIEWSDGRTELFTPVNANAEEFTFYTNQDGSTTFHMGAADNSINSEAVNNPDGTMSIEWSDGRTELFTPVNANAEEFTFYTNQELQYIALAYYGAQTGYYPQHSGVQSNDDGTASIQLYDIMEDHNSTSAWYTIDRVTLTGTDDISGDTVDMTAYADAAQQAYQ